MMNLRYGRIAQVFLFFGLIAAAAAPACGATSKIVSARAGIVIDRATGEVLWSYNPDKKLPPASTTKVVTAALALHSGRLDESFRVTRLASREPPSKIALRAGWEVELEDLIYAIMLNSANDASVVIAEGISGSVEAFSARMNVFAYSLGATNSHFRNPNGLPAEGHLSTVRDLATIFDYALDNAAFKKILGTGVTAIRPTSGSRKRITLRSKNRLLTKYQYKVIGKTGYTRAAKKCFVGSATADGREIVFAILGSDDLWGDVRRLVEFGMEGGREPLPRTQLHLAAAPRGNQSFGSGDSDEAPGGPFYVRVATFKGRSYATRLETELRRDGLPARVYTIHRSGRALYRVSVGGYPSKRAAGRVQNQIERRRPKLDTLIVRG